MELRRSGAARLPREAVQPHLQAELEEPVGIVLGEVHRVLKPGGAASIFDLRRDASAGAIDGEVQRMNLSRVSSALTRWTLRALLKRAYSREDLARMAAQSRFGACEIGEDGIGFELRLAKRG